MNELDVFAVMERGEYCPSPVAPRRRNAAQVVQELEFLGALSTIFTDDALDDISIQSIIDNLQ